MLMEGIFTAATTCFTGEGKLFQHKLERNIERLSRTAVAGIVVLGSTGEAVMLSDDESRSVLHAAIQAASREKVMIAGVGRESVLETLRLAEYAAERKYDAVLVRTPHFYRPQMREKEMLHYYRMVADQSPLPVLLYSIPAYTLYDLPVPVVAELAQHPNVIGIKDSSGNVERIAQLVEATRSFAKRNVPVTQTFAAVTERMQIAETEAEAMASANFLAIDQIGVAEMVAPAVPASRAGTRTKRRTKEVGFQVLAGSAQTMLASFHAGATGAVLALAAFAPQSCAEVYMAFKDKDAALEAEKQERLVSPSKRIVGRIGIPAIKYACDLNGYYGGVPRAPLLPLNVEERREVEMLVADLHS
jgi:dihydrodipicolinate synthase/N-acetylneuraminate lyase